jgi:DNA-directed RNA polymerase subunit RPC12/RpoP
MALPTVGQAVGFGDPTARKRGEMAASGRLVGVLLLGFGLILGVGITLWLIFSVLDRKTERTGAVFGFVLLFGCLVLPLVGGGIYFLVKGRAEAKDIARVQEQRRLLDIVTTRGQVSIADLVLEMNATRDSVQRDLNELVGRGLFSGYVDWNKGMLYSVEASKLQGQTHCPNCGGELQLAGKGLIKCPYCGAEIFLTG